VNVDSETLVRGNLSVNLGVQQKSVGTEENVAPSRNDPFYQPLQLGIDCGFTPTDGNNWSSGLFDSLEAPSQGRAVFQTARMPFRGAADASQIAGVKRFQHQYHGEATVPTNRISQLVLDGVRRDM
jgi:hypothetical protein